IVNFGARLPPLCQKPQKIAPFLILLAGILWGTIGLFIRVLNDKGMESMDIVMVRAIVTAILLFIYLFLYDKSLLKIRWKDLWCFLGTGLCSIVFFNYCYFKAITLTSLSIAAVLLYTAPAIVMVLSVLLFQEKVTAQKIVAIIATFLGCMFVTGIIGSAEGLNAVGILVGLGSGFGYALYSIFSRFALERGYHSLTISFYTFLLAMFGTFPFSSLSKIRMVCLQSPSMVVFCLIFGLFSTVIPYIVYTTGLKEMENSKASIIASIEPVTATLMGVLLYHERLKGLEALGVFLVIGSIIISNIEWKRRTGMNPEN
ncbi:MAG: EamA family transporter, partial [Eubacteriales bacterium]|nr:EamA family transporter [Eubacteriales bacterium]